MKLTLIVRFVTFAVGLQILLGCAPQDDFHPQPGRTARLENLTPEEKRQVAPNDLFTAVMRGDLATTKTKIDERPALLASQNEKNGDTPLALALRLGEKQIAIEIAHALDYQQFGFKNNDDEGYVFLASKYGFPEIIEILAERKYNLEGTWTDFSFSELDFKNKDQLKGLHVAHDRRVAQMLQNYYYKGFAERPYWAFMMSRNDKRQLFLHTAALDGRSDVILWATEELCGISDWEKEGGWIKFPLAFGYTRAKRGLQTFVGDAGLWFDLLFNRKDTDGNTALHLAALKKNELSVRALSQCEWVDYQLENGDGDLPLQTFLKAIDPKENHATEEEKSLFFFLAGQKTRMRFWTDTTDYINSANHAGDTSLHIAARLADRSLYVELAKVGNIFATNNLKQTPDEIYRARQADLGTPVIGARR